MTKQFRLTKLLIGYSDAVREFFYTKTLIVWIEICMIFSFISGLYAKDCSLYTYMRTIFFHERLLQMGR